LVLAFDEKGAKALLTSAIGARDRAAIPSIVLVLPRTFKSQEQKSKFEQSTLVISSESESPTIFCQNNTVHLHIFIESIEYLISICEHFIATGENFSSELCDLTLASLEYSLYFDARSEIGPVGPVSPTVAG